MRAVAGFLAVGAPVAWSALSPALSAAPTLAHSCHYLQNEVAARTRAIRAHPDNAAAYRARSLLRWRRGEHEKAILDALEAARLNSRLAAACLARAIAEEWEGDLDRAIGDYSAALRLDADDPAAKFEAWPKARLTEADLEHGRRQVREMLRDRPPMAEFGGRADALCRWAERKFAGEDLAGRIYWEDVPPQPGFDGQCCLPSPGAPARIRVRLAPYRQRKARSFEEMWADVVYELYNVSTPGPSSASTTTRARASCRRRSSLAR